MGTYGAPQLLSYRKDEDPKRGDSLGVFGLTSARHSLEYLVAPANAGNPSVSVPNNLHAAFACVGVIIVVCPGGPLSIRFTISRAVVVSGGNADAHSVRPIADINALCVRRD
jgi:hypothetical protein